MSALETRLHCQTFTHFCGRLFSLEKLSEAATEVCESLTVQPRFQRTHSLNIFSELLFLIPPKSKRGVCAPPI